MYTLLIVEEVGTQLKNEGMIINQYFQNNFEILYANDYDLAVQYMNQNTIDIFILDSNLEDTKYTANDFALGTHIRSLNKYLYTPIIMITTSSEKMEFAINTLHCFSYIIKPYSSETIINSINAIIQSPFIKEVTLHFNTIYGISVSLEESDIIYIESDSRCVLIHTHDTVYSTKNYTLEQLSKLLLHTLIRCHRKYMINIHEANDYDRTNQLVHCLQNCIPIGRSYREFFETQYNGT